ncbi:MAG: hypothetical protein HRU29_04920 [Rhizobiales bacterium]|nr:hypothetical protein [Hyphomicrobiales bacterium]NRB13726.1 hypothetical protein [Hyphomicrobiales bacterium]
MQSIKNIWQKMPRLFKLFIFLGLVAWFIGYGVGEQINNQTEIVKKLSYNDLVIAVGVAVTVDGMCNDITFWPNSLGYVLSLKDISWDSLTNETGDNYDLFMSSVSRTRSRLGTPPTDANCNEFMQLFGDNGTFIPNFLDFK